MINNKFSLVCFVVCALLSFSHTSNANIEVLDSIAAVVDDDVVLRSELDQRLVAVKDNLERSGQTIPPESDLRTAILNQMILESLQLQRGQRAGVRISEEQLDRALSNVARSNGTNFETFRNQLLANGSYYLVQDQLRREMIIDQVQQGSLSRRVNITPDELDAFLASPEGQDLAESRYQLAHILVPLTGNESSAQKRQAEQLAQQAKIELEKGESSQAWFQARQKAIQIGNLGWRTKEQLPSLFGDVVESLEVGEVSDVLPAGNGFHIVRLIDASGQAMMVTQYKSRHILIKTSAILDDSQAEAQANELRQRAIDGEDFEELAKEFSEDIGSAQDGGDLGWSRPGMFVPQFEQTLETLEIGEISTAFQSQFGWHIIFLEDVKDTDMREDVLKNRAYGVLRERKFDDVRAEWLQEMRDSAYVDIK